MAKGKSQRFTEQDLQNKKFVSDGNGGYKPAPGSQKIVNGKAAPEEKKEMKPARGKFSKLTKRRGQMNKTEKTYADYLDALMQAGHIHWWAYEAITLRLASDTRYTPDFMIQLPDGEIVLHEVKGAEIMFTADSKVRVKVCAAMFPFKIFVCMPRTQKMGGGWNINQVKSDE